MYAVELAGYEMRAHEAAQTFLRASIKCERSGLRLISKLLGHTPMAEEWFCSIIMQRATIGRIARILNEVSKQATPSPLPRELSRGLEVVAEFRNRVAHEDSAFDPESGTFVFTNAGGKTTTFQLEELEAKAEEARRTAELLDELVAK
jgi:hypothetical protein